MPFLSAPPPSALARMRAFAAAAAALALSACAEPQPGAADDPEPPLASRHMVAAANPAAVEIALATLRRGGSALDAAIAAQMALGVVEPQASGLGGGGFLLHFSPRTGRVVAYDGRETAPAAATPALFLGRDGAPLQFPEAVASGLSVGVPGVVRMLELAHREHGKLPWGELFAPAAALARDGFAVPPRLARLLAQERALQRDPAARAIFFEADGSPRKAGARIANPALADTLELVARGGADALHRGAVAEDIVRAVRAAARPGALTLADVAGYRPVVREALCGPYREWTVCGMPPPSSGGIAVLQALGMLERFGLAREAPNSPRALHLIAEASKLAFADRDRYVADPAFVAVPVRQMLEPAYLARRAGLISGTRALPARAEPGVPVVGLALPSGDDRDSELAATSHMTIVDGEGDVVSFTTTVEAAFGSRLFVRGFLLNNQLTDFRFVPTDDGRVVANRPEPGKRPRSSMSPTVVLDRDGRFVLAVGSAGGARIIGDALHVLVATLDWDLPMRRAIALPRVANRNGATELEAGTALEAAAERLRTLGHTVEIAPHNGGLAGLRRRAGGYEGGADPRRDGVARGE